MAYINVRQYVCRECEHTDCKNYDWYARRCVEYLDEDEQYDTYEEALAAAIEYCVDNLI